MRRLMWFTLGFGLACGLFAYLLPTDCCISVGAVCLALAGAGMILRKRKVLFRILCLCLVGAAVGACCFSVYVRQYLRPVFPLADTTLQFTFLVSDYSEDLEYSRSVEGWAEIDGREYRLMAYLPKGDPLAPGDVVTGSFLVRVPMAQEDYASGYYQGKGIYLILHTRAPVTVIPAQAVPARFCSAWLRERILGVLHQALPEKILPLCKALLLGDTDDLDYVTDTALKISGIRHIVAVSGLHISILYTLLAGVTMKRRYLTAMIGIPVLVLFAAVAGFTPSVTRACVMVGLMMLASVFQREYDSPTALAFSCLGMLVVNPLTVTSVSLQLSVGCVAGILLFQRALYDWFLERFPKSLGKSKGILGKVIRGICTSISMSLSAMSLTTPISSFYFGTISLVGVITNLLTLWVVTLLFMGLVAVCFLWPVLPGIAVILGKLLTVPAGFVLWVAKVMSSVPLAAVYLAGNYIVFWLGFVYLLLAVFLLQRNRQPVIAVCLSLISLCVCLMLSWLEPQLDDTRITMLDVGQGQSVLLQSEGCTFLVDCGGDSDTVTADTVAQALLGQGISRLDGIILTHYDADHAGALHNLLTRIDCDLLIVPRTEGKEFVQDLDVTVYPLTHELQLTFGTARITVYGPVFAGESNENSLCVLFDTEKCDILITGDRTEFGEDMLLRKTRLPDVDVLVAGHHGSADSTSPALLQAVNPEIVLISVGEGNFYGHPDPDLLSRLREAGCEVYRTDLNGTIVIRR